MTKKDVKQVNFYKREIIRLFLTIHINHIKKSLKLNELPHYESRYQLVQKKGSYENYELIVSIGESNYNRLMSLRLLAEGSGAKSIVFEVIYDIHIVIKIPPKKITDFSIYLRKVTHEKSVVNCLDDQIVTIVPEFQCILKKIHPLEEKVGLANNKRIEEKYVHLLTKNQKLHRFLQLDGGYVFFMYLSRNKTLGDFIRLVYNETEMVEKEIRENEGIFWDAQSFQGRYELHEWKHIEEDGELDQLFLKYNEAFEFIDAYLKSVIRDQYKIQLETYQTRRWFLTYLSNQRLNIKDEQFPEGFVQTLTIAFKYIIHNYSETFDKFFQVLRSHSEQRRYTFNKEKLRIVCSNLLVIFTILFKKGVSHRDLKPDNIIIVANNFERSEMVQSEIGLIDFETAFAVSLEDNIEMTGGTPQFSALSQLYRSNVLADIYGETYKEIYRYQDLYASVGIIYQLFTGKTLFGKTRLVFKKVFAQLAKDPSLATKAEYIRISKSFWETAVKELREKIETNESVLKSFQIRLHADDMQEFLNVFFPNKLIAHKIKTLESAQTHLLKHQTIFTPEQVAIIKNSDADRIIGLIKKNEKKGMHDPIVFLKKIQQIKESIEFFGSIQHLKRDIDSYQALRMQLKDDSFEDEEREILEIQLTKQKESIQERPGIRVYHLIKYFFGMTLNKMYLKEWGALQPICGNNANHGPELDFYATL